MHIDDLLRIVVEQQGSDLHVKAGQPPIIRVHGLLRRTDLPPLSADDTRRLVYAIEFSSV